MLSLLKTVSKANACIDSSHFALGFLRMQLCLEKQAFLMPCQDSTAPLFILSWQTCPLNVEQDLTTVMLQTLLLGC